MGRLTGIETVLLDLDGTLYVGSQVVAGAPQAVRWLRDQGLTVRFTTNTTRSPRPPSPDRVARLGSPASEDELVTPIAVAERLFAPSPQARVLAGCPAGPGDRVTHVLVAESRLRGDLR